ncbi:MAG: PilT/PilU family type 4a pilus ATPase [Verrucomicrobiaceae bacterium]|nr:PilT/PilU family type 4a pilus ATPase [Verrucomicrobiaceae bacterium]
MHAYDLIEYLAMVIERGGSDLHLSANAPPMARIHGVLQPLTDEILDQNDSRELILNVLKESQRAKLEHEWELDFAVQVENLGRFRGNACYVLGRIEANFRYIPDTIPELVDLGHGATVERLATLRDGLILITGTTGSGKTTTLCSMTQAIARSRSTNIISIEDPIEFVFEHGRSLIRQRQVGSDTNSFASAMKSALRQDADVIVVSELRDLETMRTAIQAAETGHLVISTLHTSEATGTLTRIFDAFPEEQQDYVAAQLSSCLRGVVCQHLLPRKDGLGRVLATEIMTMNHGIGRCIRDRRFSMLAGLIQIGAKDGMHTIDDSLLHLLIHDFIEEDHALAHCRDQDFIRSNYRKHLEEIGAIPKGRKR